MRHNRLRLVVPENRAQATIDGPTELSAVPTTSDSGVRRLRVMDTDEGASPDDAA